MNFDFSTNWEKCFLCQEDRDEALICPANNPSDKHRCDGYKTIVDNLSEFEKLGSIPLNVR